MSSGDRTRAERRLERGCLDIDALRANFVSYQTIRAYLQNERFDPDEPMETSLLSIPGRVPL